MFIFSFGTMNSSKRRLGAAFVPTVLLMAVLTTVLTAPAVFAADALLICESGTPFVWPGAGANIPFNPDQGDLGPLDNAQAVALTQQAFDVWAAVPEATASYVDNGLLPVDVDITNFGPFLNPTAPDGLSAIVFDDTGEIFDLLFGPGSGILGFAGPEWVDPTACEILEGSSFLNGPAFADLTAALDVMVHEFGHYSNLGHVELNGQLVAFGEGGDNTGPSPTDTFPLPSFSGTEVIETMYPIYFGPAVGTRTPHADDVAALAAIYPSAALANRGSISGTIFAPNGTTRLSGVNVIARNIDDPFVDAVSTFSGALTDSTSQDDPVVGTFELGNLTPGASYVVFVDVVTAQAGRFSNPILQPLPGPEEFWNGANEANLNPPDDPQAFEVIVPAAGSATTGVDIVFNQPAPGEPLPVGDDGSVTLALPFTFCIAGQPFDSLFVNANGNLTFGQPDGAFTESVGGMLVGPPRIAGLWDDLNPSAGGIVTFDQTNRTFTVSWTDVPEFFATGANTFSITLRENRFDCAFGRHHLTDGETGEDDGFKTFFSADVTIEYGALTATDGIAGVSGGASVTSGFETEIDLTSFGQRKIRLDNEAAVFEVFDGDLDLTGTSQRYDVGRGFRDRFEPNDRFVFARTARLPFDTVDTRRSFTAIDPAGDDVDFFKLRRLEAGTTLIAEVLTGQIDSVLGLFQCGRFTCRENSATLVAVDDDGGQGILSRIVFEIPEDGDYILGVSTFPDTDFSGDGNTDPVFGQGRYVLDVFTVDGVLLDLGDDDSQEVAFDFTFPFQGGLYSSVFVNSNGNLTFGVGDGDFSESVFDFLGGAPRIAALWDDLSPNNAGLVVVREDTDCLEVQFIDVPEFITTGANTFSVVFDVNGNVNIDLTALTAPDGLVGITEGNGAADPGETDLSAAGPLPVAGTTYEIFTFGETNDLGGTSVIFGDDISCGDNGGGGRGHHRH